MYAVGFKDGMYAVGRAVGWYRPVNRRGVELENLFGLALWCGGRWSLDLADACVSEAGQTFPWRVPMKSLSNPELIGRGVNDGGWFLALSFNRVDPDTQKEIPAFSELWNPELFGQQICVGIEDSFNPKGRYLDFWARELTSVGRSPWAD
jgi:hypothetical protein